MTEEESSRNIKNLEAKIKQAKSDSSVSSSMLDEMKQKLAKMKLNHLRKFGVAGKLKEISTVLATLADPYA